MAAPLRLIPPPRTVILDDTKLPGRLVDLLRAGGWVMMGARASAAGGAQACSLAVDGIYTGAEHLARDGCDVRPFLPSPSELSALVRTQARRSEYRDSTGKRFTNHAYCHVDEDMRLVLLVQFGTGVKLTEEYRQPAVLTVARAIAEHQPALVFANEVRGWGRTGFGLAELVRELYHQTDQLGEPVYVGDVENSVSPFGPEVEKRWFEDGTRLAREARDTRRRTRAGMRLHCPTGAVSGWFRYPLPNPLPPPFATAWVKPPGEPAYAVAFLDTRLCRPDPALVLHGMPTGSGGRGPADQLELLRWVYRNYLRPGWDLRATAAYLAAHGYSTIAVRRARGPGATALLRTEAKYRRSDASHLVRSIWKHRGFHSTGRLTVRIDPDHTVTWQVQTPDGLPIARSEDVDRIERVLRDQRSVRDRPTVHTFTGQPLQHNGQPAALTPVYRRSGTLVYCYTRTDPRHAGERRRSAGVPLPATTLAEAILTALADTRLLPRHPDPNVRRQREAVRDAAGLDAAAAATARDAAAAHVIKPELHGSGLAAAQAAVDHAERRLVSARGALDAAESALRALTADDAESALPVREVLDLAAALQNPRDPTYRAIWRSAISDFTATSRRWFALHDLQVGEVVFGCTLTLADERGRLWQVPVTGRYLQDPGPRLRDRMLTTIAGMRDGVTPRETLGSNWRSWLPHLRAALGGPAHGVNVVVNVTDPRLLRLGMAVAHPPLTGVPPTVPGLDPADMPRLVAAAPLGKSARTRLAHRLGEPPELLHRLTDLYLHPTTAIGAWLRPCAPRTAGLLHDAHRRPLRETELVHLAPSLPDHAPMFATVRGRLKPRACPHCGSRHRALSRLREVTGLVCTRCHRDDAGVRWPADPYDAYLNQRACTSSSTPGLGGD